MKLRTLDACLAAALLSVAASAQTYGYSDGSAEQSLGLPTGGDIAWFQSLDTGDHSLAADLIVEIGAVNASASIGASGGVAVYQDPNNDSDPSDLGSADLRAMATWTVASAGSTTFEGVQLCPNASVSGKFWICVWVPHTAGQMPAPIDTSQASNGRSWVTGAVLGAPRFDPQAPNAATNVPWSELSLLGPLFDGVWVLSGNHDPMTIHVDEDATGAGDGSSWADAFTSLQDALCLAHDADEIWVAEGRYLPDDGLGFTPGDRTASFYLKDGVEVLGGFDGSETSRNQRSWEDHPTILDGDLDGDDTTYAETYGTGFNNYDENSCNVVRSPSGTLASAVLDGFHVRGGHAFNTGGCNDRGGGAYLAGDPTVRNTVFRENYSWVAAVVATGAPTIERSTFLDNRAYYAAGALLVAGANADLWLQDCTFLGNVCERQWGGAILIEKGAMATVVNGLFSGNYATYNGGAVCARLEGAQMELYGCTIANNEAYGSVSSQGGGVQIEFGCSARIVDTILYDNEDGGGSDESAQIHVNGSVDLDYSCVQGLSGAYGGGGNTGANPAFVNALGDDMQAGTLDDDLRLRRRSACIDAGDNGSVPPGVAYDIAGSPRIQNSTVDMGAYESMPPRYETTPLPDAPYRVKK